MHANVTTSQKKSAPVTERRSFRHIPIRRTEPFNAKIDNRVGVCSLQVRVRKGCASRYYQLPKAGKHCAHCVPLLMRRILTIDDARNCIIACNARTGCDFDRGWGKSGCDRLGIEEFGMGLLGNRKFHTRCVCYSENVSSVVM